ncbi:MAG: CSLREA domain-containing protein [Blastocatellales bacterium]
MNLTLNISLKMKLMALAFGLLAGVAVWNVINRSAQNVSAKADEAASHEPMPSLQGQPIIDHLCKSTAQVTSSTTGDYTNTIPASGVTTGVGVSNASPANATLTVNCPTSFTVNDLGDAADANTGDGVCSTSGGVCTLRAAIQEANALNACSSLMINFSVTGLIDTLNMLPTIDRDLVISGPGASNLNIGRTGSRQVTFHRILLIASSRTVTISGVTISGGRETSSSGAGIYNSGGLTLSNCVITGNQSK